MSSYSLPFRPVGFFFPSIVHELIFKCFFFYIISLFFSLFILFWKIVLEFESEGIERLESNVMIQE